MDWKVYGHQVISVTSDIYLDLGENWDNTEYVSDKKDKNNYCNKQEKTLRDFSKLRTAIFNIILLPTSTTNTFHWVYWQFLQLWSSFITCNEAIQYRNHEYY